MLFLMNDWVMQFDQRAMVADLVHHNIREITFPQVLVLGQELYAEDPQLHLRQPLQARKLAALVMAMPMAGLAASRAARSARRRVRKGV